MDEHVHVATFVSIFNKIIRVVSHGVDSPESPTLYPAYIYIHLTICMLSHRMAALQVAAYDFQLPVLVNRARPPSPPPSPWPPSSHHTSKITIRPHPQQTNGKQSRGTYIVLGYIYTYVYNVRTCTCMY